MSNDIKVTLSGNSTPLLPTEQYDQIRARDETITSLRARLAEAEARAGRAEEAVKKVAKLYWTSRMCHMYTRSMEEHDTDLDHAIKAEKAVNEDPTARAAVEGANP